MVSSVASGFGHNANCLMCRRARRHCASAVGQLKCIRMVAGRVVLVARRVVMADWRVVLVARRVLMVTRRVLIVARRVGVALPMAGIRLSSLPRLVPLRGGHVFLCVNAVELTACGDLTALDVNVVYRCVTCAA